MFSVVLAEVMLVVRFWLVCTKSNEKGCTKLNRIIARITWYMLMGITLSALIICSNGVVLRMQMSMPNRAFSITALSQVGSRIDA